MKPLHYLRLTGKTVKEIAPIDKLKFGIDKLIGYKEVPCEGKADSGGDKNSVSAHDLFSLFTADIIKSNTFFVR